MNRNQMYDYLKSLNLKTRADWHDNGYHIIFEDNPKSDYKIEKVIFDWGNAIGVESIHLFPKFIYIEFRFGFGNMSVLYSTMNKFKVKMCRKDEEY